MEDSSIIYDYIIDTDDLTSQCMIVAGNLFTCSVVITAMLPVMIGLISWIVLFRALQHQKCKITRTLVRLHALVLFITSLSGSLGLLTLMSYLSSMWYYRSSTEVCDYTFPSIILGGWVLFNLILFSAFLRAANKAKYGKCKRDQDVEIIRNVEEGTLNDVTPGMSTDERLFVGTMVERSQG